jgi:WD40 repeat protein
MNKYLLAAFVTISSLAYCQTEVLVSSAATGGNNQVLRFSGKTGRFLGVFTCGRNADDPRGMRQRPPNKAVIYINSANDEVLAYSAVSGEFLGVFAQFSGLNGGAGVFGPDFNYYVGSRTLQSIVRFDGKTGAFIDNFVSLGTVKFVRGFDFASDGNLYIANGAPPGPNSGGTILQVDGKTGDILNPHFVEDSQLAPLDLVIGPDGQIYVSSEFPFGQTNSHGTVRRYDPATGKLTAVFDAGNNDRGKPLLSRPRGLFFAPDGLLYVSSPGTDSVVRFNWQTGQFVDSFIHYAQLNGQAVSVIAGERDRNRRCEDEGKSHESD